MEKKDVLVVTRLYRLGRDAIDVSQTVAELEKIGIRVHCLALGGVDCLTPVLAICTSKTVRKSQTGSTWGAARRAVYQSRGPTILANCWNSRALYVTGKCARARVARVQNS